MEKIILFGTGKFFSHKADILNRYEVVQMLDNKVPIGSAAEYHATGIKIINPNDMAIDGQEPVYLMSMNFVPMWKQLVGLGISPERIVYPYFEKPYFQSDSVVDEYIDDIVFAKTDFIVREKNGTEHILETYEEWLDLIRDFYKRKNPIIAAISEMAPYPISEVFATERGTPVDRIYIERFLEKNSSYIKGDILEIEDSTYTKKFGDGKVTNSIIMDVSSDSEKIDFNANLETGEGIRDNVADCFILTQTLMYIFDLEATVKNIVRMLKPGGVALITASFLSQNSQRCMDNYGAYFNFNSATFEKLFNGKGAMVLDSGSYGNVKTVMAHLVGMCAEDLDESDFDTNDKYYPLIVYAVVRKDE